MTNINWEIYNSVWFYCFWWGRLPRESLTLCRVEDLCGALEEVGDFLARSCSLQKPLLHTFETQAWLNMQPSVTERWPPFSTRLLAASEVEMVCVGKGMTVDLS